MALPSREVTVVSQNVLLDYRRTTDGLILPQDVRIDAIAATLESIDGTLDVVGIQEAHKSKNQHNGEVLANQLGYGPGFWFEHNSKPKKDSLNPIPRKGRANEFMGMFGSMVESAEAFDIGDRRKAVMTTIAGVAFLTLHLRAGWGARPLRKEQSYAVIDILKNFPDAVAFGDFNEPDSPYLPHVSAGRNVLKDNNFQSVFNLQPNPKHSPRTSPTKQYRGAAMDGRKLHEKPFVWLGWPIDDILVRGNIAVKAAGILEPMRVENGLPSNVSPKAPREATDHRGVWAKLGIPPVSSGDR
jgi:hypothetical protein